MAYGADRQIIVLDEDHEIWIEPVDEPDRSVRMTMRDAEGSELYELESVIDDRRDDPGWRIVRWHKPPRGW